MIDYSRLKLTSKNIFIVINYTQTHEGKNKVGELKQI